MQRNLSKKPVVQIIQYSIKKIYDFADHKQDWLFAVRAKGCLIYFFI